jgi:hypothetical protein
MAMPEPTFPLSSRVHSGGPIRGDGVMAGYGASAAIFWALGWGAAFIVVFGTLTTRLCDRK